MIQEEKLKPKVEKGWLDALTDQFQSSSFKELKAFLKNEYDTHTVYPPKKQILAALDATPFNKVKVVILGQDPYHGFGQANGLAFSVSEGVKLPPSLKNIYKEIEADLGISMGQSGDLNHWASQGVLLLNATLTVRESSPTSHFGKGWEDFTDAIIQKLNDSKEGVIFLLWGNKAQLKASKVDEQKHHVLKTTHPSPFSARNGFLGSKHFSKTNQLLKSMEKTPINWQIK